MRRLAIAAALLAMAMAPAEAASAPAPKAAATKKPAPKAPGSNPAGKGSNPGKGRGSGSVLPAPRIPTPTEITEDAAAAEAVLARGPAVAALLLDPTDHGFALTHAAGAMGFPLVRTRDAKLATRFPMLVLSGEASGQRITPELQAALEAYVKDGGLLVLDSVEAKASLELAGLAYDTPRRTRSAITFKVDTQDPGFAQLTRPGSQTISLGGKDVPGVWTHALTAKASAHTRVLARFDDGTVALSTRTLGKGRIYTFGVRLQDLILRPQVNRDFEAQRAYDNHFEPSADVPQLILRGWFMTLPDAVALDPAPDGRSGSLVLTHDIDFQRSVQHMPAYLEAEKRAGVRSTFFVQTKIVKDYEDIAFFDDASRATIRQVLAGGGDMESHTVAHAYDFKTFATGDGSEDARTYRPFVVSGDVKTHTGVSRGGTVWGEVHVSRQLLEAVGPELAARRVVAFRTGYLAINPAMWTVLDRDGYRYDSSYSANDVMSSFPYPAMADANFERETPIMEFPVMLADSLSPLMPHVDQLRGVLDDEATLHGMVVALIHTDMVGEKLDVEEALISHVKGRFWIGSLRDFARFWAGRGKAVVSVRHADGDLVLGVEAGPDAEGLTVDLPRAMQLVKAEGADAELSAGGKAVILRGLASGKPVKLTLR